MWNLFLSIKKIANHSTTRDHVPAISFLASSNGIVTATLKSKLLEVRGRLPDVYFGIHNKQDTTALFKDIQFRTEILTPSPIVVRRWGVEK